MTTRDSLIHQLVVAQKAGKKSQVDKLLKALADTTPSSAQMSITLTVEQAITADQLDIDPDDQTPFTAKRISELFQGEIDDDYTSLFTLLYDSYYFDGAQLTVHITDEDGNTAIMEETVN
mgnify:FL=1